MHTTRLRVRLEGVDPTVLRVVDVPAASTLEEVHLALQAAMGFDDSHLYEFGAGELRYGPIDPDAPEDVLDAVTTRLTALPSSFVYLYDFGDSWSHQVEVLGPGADEPGLVYGEGDEPEDDIGGGPGYEQALDAGELRPFDAGRIGRRLHRVLGRVPGGLQVVLDLLDGGVRLTPRGRLPQAFVREVQRARPTWHRLGDEGRPAHREDDLRPLAALHHLVLETRLARVRDRVVTPTKAAADPFEVLRRVRAAFSVETFLGMVVHHVVARLLTEGPLHRDDLVETLHDVVGRFWGLDGRPLTEDDMATVLAQNTNVLLGLEQVEDEGPLAHRTWRAGPEAGWLMPRTALLAPDDLASSRIV
ncbi:plasmid pRiA4b ORF-3 family protein [Actinomycetospora straminea]|uniref:Plasmid pRiA4b Orf3-like domain-containing protein n=1 Tax=Actinomycetospora straminea TaxID=663607 RepID=A0ABP9EQ81_9PSEU|nr:plasmid pRiA4b ORF-3 family protein [Actinomycetospora straminea]MDD7933988.1 plasmid pRiA4b ORF-3 family protein [Actinomycetospora straminea]